MRRRAFTLVEVTVTVAVVAALTAVLLPGLSAVSGMSRRTKCQSNADVTAAARVATAATSQGEAYFAASIVAGSRGITARKVPTMPRK